MTPTPRDRAQAREITGALRHAWAWCAERPDTNCQTCWLTLKIATALAAREAETREACAKMVEEYESDAFAEFSNQRDKLKAIAHLDGIAKAIRAIAATREGQ